VANTNEALVQRVINVFNGLGSNPHIKRQDATYATRRRLMYWLVVAVRVSTTYKNDQFGGRAADTLVRYDSPARLR
jgi:hypothetical protein